MPTKHALLSASSSERWIHCPPSARLSESYEDKGSDYAAEGTDAHSLCEFKLKTAFGMEANDPTEGLTYYDQEMDDSTTGYAAYVLEQVEAEKEVCSDPVVLIEQRVDFSRWVEQGFGTADCIIIADGTLQIIDFKYGLGVLVSAEENPQMMCYALGALELFDDIYDISTVRMTIYQPRRDNLSTYELSKEDLFRWAEDVLKPAADLAFAGDGNFLCGEWCGFCKAKNACRARAAANLELAKYEFKLPPLLTDEDGKPVLIRPRYQRIGPDIGGVGIRPLPRQGQQHPGAFKIKGLPGPGDHLAVSLLHLLDGKPGRAADSAAMRRNQIGTRPRLHFPGQHGSHGFVLEAAVDKLYRRGVQRHGAQALVIWPGPEPELPDKQ